MSTSWVARSTVTPTSRIRAGNGPARRRRDRVDRRQPAVVDQPAELEHGRVEPLDVADLDRAPRSRGPRRRSASPRRSWPRAASRRGPRCPRSMAARASGTWGRRGGDDDGVELRLGDHRQRLREALGAGLGGRRRRGPRSTGSATATSRMSVPAAEDPEVVAAHRPEAREADPQRRGSPAGRQATGHRPPRSGRRRRLVGAPARRPAECRPTAASPPRSPGPARRRSGPGTSAGPGSGRPPRRSRAGRRGDRAPGCSSGDGRGSGSRCPPRRPPRAGPRRSRPGRPPTSSVYWWNTWVRPVRA